MVFSLGVSAVLALAASTTSVLASPWPQSSTAKFGTHRVRDLAHGVSVTTYQPASTFETYGEGVDHPLSKRAGPPATHKEAALSFVASKTGLHASNVTYRTGFEGQAATHAYLHQNINGIDIVNAVSNIALKNDKVVAYGNAFIKPASVASPTPKLTSAEAIAKAESHLQATYNKEPTELKYLALDSDHVVLTYQVAVRSDSAWWMASVDAHTGEVVNVINYTAHASYWAIPYTYQNAAQQNITNPQNLTSSPNGWHTSLGTTYTTTRGNNVIVYKSTTAGTTAQSSATNNYYYPFASASAPTVTANINAARTNAFYIANWYHDVTYAYGFTEAAYNFQFDNLSKGGKANDGVTLSVQDSAGSNNADFSTPADGSSGHCRMFTWTYTTPNRDGALENDIITHELTHGTSNRLTGGGTGACLQTTEAGGMGEGWSDTFAIVTEKTSSSLADVNIGVYVYGKGIRAYPYSLSATVNPYTYASLKTLTEVHGIGTVWANILYNVYGALVTAKGWEANLYNTGSTAGNIVFLHLFIDAFSIQPCNPTFLTARTAFIQADANRYGGANKCLLWKAFASKGLGVNAASHNNDATLPSGC